MELVSLRLKDIRPRKLISVNLTDSLEEICRVLEENKLRKVPVMDHEEMVGIINRSNITQYALNSYKDLLSENGSW